MSIIACVATTYPANFSWSSTAEEERAIDGLDGFVAEYGLSGDLNEGSTYSGSELTVEAALHLHTSDADTGTWGGEWVGMRLTLPDGEQVRRKEPNPTDQPVLSQTIDVLTCSSEDGAFEACGDSVIIEFDTSEPLPADAWVTGRLTVTVLTRGTATPGPGTPDIEVELEVTSLVDR